ncbi:MAG: lipase family protein [Pirellulaceae bacterium]
MPYFPLIPDAHGFSVSNAFALAQAAELAYADFAEIRRMTIRDWDFRECHCLEASETQAFVATRHDAIVVAMRGTESKLEDWVTDGNCSLVRGPLGGKVHAGFYEGLSHVWAELDGLVRQATAREAKPVWIAGHSLGGALAALAAARWLDQGQSVQGVYTFGQPRSGDATFARNFNFAIKPRAFRIVNDNDFVTRVPPRAFGYSHAGTFMYLNDRGELDSDVGWWDQFLDRWAGALDDIFEWMTEGLSDHRMTAYRDLIERLLPVLSEADEFSRNLGAFLRAASRHARQPRQPQRRAA